MDAFDLAEPVDVFQKVPKDLHENLGSSKWKDRKDALDGLHAAVNVPRIKEGPLDEIIRALAKSMKDANIAVVTVAANCVECLAKGLKKSFGRYRSQIMAPMLERLKEKKQSVADALGAALDAVFASTSLSECLEEILEFLKHKNPQVKVETLKFLIRCLKTTRDVPSTPEVKSIAEAGTKLLTESTEAMRAGGAEILGTLMKIMGERAMNPYLEGLDDIRKTKIKEFFDVAEVKAKNKPKPAAPPPKAAAPAQKKPLGTKKPAAGGLKKPAPKATPPPEEPSSPPQLQPRPTTGKSKLGGARLAKPGLTKKISGPGGAAPPHAPSPAKASFSATAEEDEAPPQPKLGRGLAGRPLGKPAAAAAPPPAAPVSQGMSAVERAELEELRGDKESLQRTNSDLRSERSRLQSQIHELQNQNAQLIEDHTRDVLSIKAKETQLVRARSDAEAAESTVQKQQREIERLKRELSRSVRATSPPPLDVSDQIYRDANGGYSSQQQQQQHPSLSRLDSQASGRSSRAGRMFSPSEEKENGFEPAGRSKMSPPLTSSRPLSRQSPARPPVGSRAASERNGSSIGQRMGGGSESADGEGSPAEPAENWKRAAEVTSQLKARIEQMKVRSILHPLLVMIY